MSVVGRRISGVIRSLVNARGLHETLLMPVLMYGNETMIWKEEERSRIRLVQMDKIRSLLDIRRMDKVPNTWIKESCRMAKVVDERIEEENLHWFSHVKKMENDRSAKILYASSSSAGQPRKGEVD